VALIFAGTLLVIQIGRCVFLVVLLRGQERQRVPVRVLIWHAAIGVLLVTGALGSSTERIALWTVAVALIHIGRWFSYPAPELRRLGGAELPPLAPTWPNGSGAVRHRTWRDGVGYRIDAHRPRFDTARTVAFVMTFVITLRGDTRHQADG
jgi:hypothetical protein